MIPNEKIKNLFLIFLIIFAVILIFAFVDFLLHSLSVEYAVPPRYFPHKILYGTIYGFFIFLLVRKQSPFMKALLFSLVVDISLQTRYFLEGYPFDFVFLFLILHFLILLPVSWMFFKLVIDKKIEKDIYTESVTSINNDIEKVRFSMAQYKVIAITTGCCSDDVNTQEIEQKSNALGTQGYELVEAYEAITSGCCSRKKSAILIFQKN